MGSLGTMGMILFFNPRPFFGAYVRYLLVVPVLLLLDLKPFICMRLTKSATM